MTVQAYLQAKNKSGVCPINVRYFHDSVFFPIGIGYSIKVEEFDKKKQMVLPSHQLHQVINYKINLVKSRMLQVAQEVQLKGFEPDRELVKNAYLNSLEQHPYPELTITTINELPVIEVKEPEVIPIKEKLIPKIKLVDEPLKVDFEGVTEDFVLDLHRFSNLVTEWINSSTNTTKRTKTQRRSWLKIIYEFSIKTKISLALDNFTLMFYDRYAEWLLFGPHNLYNNSFGNNVKRLKTFLKWCETNKDIIPNKHYKSYKVLTEEKQIQNAYLDRKELNLLWEYQTFREHKEKAFQKVIDLCVFQNVTGLRWSDLTFKGGMVVETIKGQKVLIGKTQKSRYKQTYQIPLALDSRIEQLLIKYNYNFHNLVSDVEYNRRIKEVLKEMYRKHKLHQKPYRIYRYKLDQQFIVDLYKHEMIASHSNRRGWVSWCYKDLRLPEMLILKMMGSKSNQELKKYIALDTEDILSAVQALNLISEQSPLLAA